jgi:hypothetical protein
MSYFNSPKHILACPLKKKSIENCKSYIFPIKMSNSQKVTNVWNTQLSLHLRSACCLNTAYLFVFTIHTFIGDYRHTLWLVLLKMSHFNSPNPNLASSLIRKTIEYCKSYIFLMKVPNSQKNCQFISNMQPFLHLLAAWW